MIAYLPLIGLVCLCAAAAVGRAQETNFFPVMAWNSVAADVGLLKKMRECGFNIAGFVRPEVLDACAAAGIRAIVTDPRASGYEWRKVDERMARSNITSLVKQVGKHPAVYGYYLLDEPHAELFPGLAKVAAILHEQAPDKWAYINLYPNYAGDAGLGTAGYEEYLRRFIATCRPTALSYDHYALLDNGALRDGYWKNLEQVRTAAKEGGLPFWNIVLGAAHFSYREPSAADIRFQVYSTLAYGAKGIAYFTYITSTTGNYRMGAIDQFGNQTPTWYHLQHANLQIAKLAPTLLQLESDEVYHFGNLPEECHGPTTNSLITGFEAAGELMAGDFTHRDKSRFVIVVNKDVYKSVHFSPRYRTPPKRVWHVSSYTGELAGFEGEQRWLAPGQGMLLKLE